MIFGEFWTCHPGCKVFFSAVPTHPKPPLCSGFPSQQVVGVTRPARLPAKLESAKPGPPPLHGRTHGTPPPLGGGRHGTPPLWSEIHEDPSHAFFDGTNLTHDFLGILELEILKPETLTPHTDPHGTPPLSESCSMVEFAESEKLQNSLECSVECILDFCEVLTIAGSNLWPTIATDLVRRLEAPTCWRCSL